jgi:hypothetical protein
VTGSAVGDIFDPGCALTQQEKLWEITELVRVRTASAGVILQRLAELDYGVDGQERQGLVTIARSAANVASREYSRVRRARPKAPLARILERNAEVPLTDVKITGSMSNAHSCQRESYKTAYKVSVGFEKLHVGLKMFRSTLMRFHVYWSVETWQQPI